MQRGLFNKKNHSNHLSKNKIIFETTISRICLFFTSSQGLENETCHQGMEVEIISGRGFQLWGSLQSRFPSDPRSQAISLYHTGAPAMIQEDKNHSFGTNCWAVHYLAARRMLTDLVSFCSEFKVGTFHNGINRACLLAESTVNALGHVNVVPVKLNQLVSERASEWVRLRSPSKTHHLVVLRLPSSRSSASMVIAWAGHIW